MKGGLRYSLLLQQLSPLHAVLTLDSLRELDNDSMDSVLLCLLSRPDIESISNGRQLLQKQVSILTKKLSKDNQLWVVASEDLQVKRKALDQMKNADKNHRNTMDPLP